MGKEISLKISKDHLLVLVWVLLAFIIIFNRNVFLKPFMHTRIVSVDLVKIIRSGQDKYKTKPEIERFTKRMNYILTSYADKQNVIILSKQVVIKGADDVTSEVSKQIFSVK